MAELQQIFAGMNELNESTKRRATDAERQAQSTQQEPFDGEDHKWREWVRAFRSWSGRCFGGALPEIYEHVEGPSHSHSDHCVSEPIDHVPPNIPNSSHSTQLHRHVDTAAVIPMINKRTLPKPRHKNAQSRFGLVV